MQIEVLYYTEEGGRKALKSEILCECRDLDKAVRSAEERVSRGRKIEILGVVVHNPEKNENVSDSIRSLYVRKRHKTYTQTKEAKVALEARGKAL